MVKWVIRFPARLMCVRLKQKEDDEFPSKSSLIFAERAKSYFYPGRKLPCIIIWNLSKLLSESRPNEINVALYWHIGLSRCSRRPRSFVRVKPHVLVKTSTGRDVWVVLSLHNEWNVLVEGKNAPLLIIHLLKMLLVGTRSGLISRAVVLVLLFWSQIKVLCRKAVTRERLEGWLQKSSANSDLRKLSVNLLNQQEVVRKSTVCI